MTVVVDGESLTLEQVLQVARGGGWVTLGPGVVERMSNSRDVVERVLARDDAVYGMTTGVGAAKRYRVAPADNVRFNRELINNHRVGHGADAPTDVVRACMLRLLNGFDKGTVGMRPRLAERLVDALNRDVRPRVRLLGSCGEADLAPLADLAHELFGTVELQPKEALALVNDNSFSTGLSALAVSDASRLVEAMTVSAALSLEAFAANITILDLAVARTRPYAGLQAELNGLRVALEGSYLWEPGAARNLQDPLSYRSVVQVQGATRDALAFARAQLGIELNAHHDNPIVLAADDRILSVGCYDVLPMVGALDFLRIALAPSLTASTERAVKLTVRSTPGRSPGCALDLRKPPRLGTVTARVHQQVRARVRFVWSRSTLSRRPRTRRRPGQVGSRRRGQQGASGGELSSRADGLVAASVPSRRGSLGGRPGFLQLG